MIHSADNIKLGKNWQKESLMRYIYNIFQLQKFQPMIFEGIFFIHVIEYLTYVIMAIIWRELLWYKFLRYLSHLIMSYWVTTLPETPWKFAYMKQALSSEVLQKSRDWYQGLCQFFYFRNRHGFDFWRSTGIILELPKRSWKQMRKIKERSGGTLNRREKNKR